MAVLQTLFMPPLTQQQMRGRLERHYHFRAGGVIDLIERDVLLGADLALLGDSTVQPRFVSCAAGTVVIVHHDLFHRVARALDSHPWRPMLKFSATRVSGLRPHSQLALRRRRTAAGGPGQLLGDRGRGRGCLGLSIPLSAWSARAGPRSAGGLLAGAARRTVRAGAGDGGGEAVTRAGFCSLAGRAS